jgi:hypothetical protein
MQSVRLRPGRHIAAAGLAQQAAKICSGPDAEPARSQNETSTEIDGR